MADIFISYSREDISLAEMLAHKLETIGWSVWWDNHIQAGKMFSVVIEEELQSARCVIVLWTKHSVTSRHVADEANEAHEKGKLVPIQAGARPPLGLRSVHCVMWNEDNIVQDEEFKQLLKHLKPVLGEPGPKSQTSGQPASPYKPGKEIPKEIPHTNSQNTNSAAKLPSHHSSPNEIFREKLSEILMQYKGMPDLFIEPGIADHKIQNARKSCDLPYREKILALFDITVFGAADNCMVFTPLGISHHYAGKSFRISWSDFSHASISTREYDVFINNELLSFAGCGAPLKDVVNLLLELKNIASEIKTDSAFEKQNEVSTSKKTENKSQHIAPKNIVRSILVLTEAFKILHGADKFYTTPNIPAHKLENARNSCKIPYDEQVLALIDLTVFGSSDECLLFTSERMAYYFEPKSKFPIYFPYSEFSGASIHVTSDTIFSKKILFNETELAFEGCPIPLQKIRYLMLEIQLSLETF